MKNRVGGVPVVTVSAQNDNSPIRAILLPPPASEPEKRAGFQETLQANGISSDFIINKGTTQRVKENYSFTTMRNDLLRVLEARASEFSHEKRIVVASCLSSIPLGLATEQIAKEHLAHGMVMGIPTSSLQSIIQANQASLESFLSYYDGMYKFMLPYRDAKKHQSLSPLEAVLSQSHHLGYKPFIYANQSSPYFLDREKILYVEGILDEKIKGILLQNHGLKHDLEDDDKKEIEKMTIAYMQEV